MLACSSVSISNGRMKVIVEKEKNICDIKNVDPNCKIKDKSDNL